MFLQGSGVHNLVWQPDAKDVTMATSMCSHSNMSWKKRETYGTHPERLSFQL